MDTVERAVQRVTKYVRKKGRRTKMKPITLITVSHNDEKILTRFFEHVRPHFDEIIVADDGSTDGSVEIINKYADKVVISEQPRYWCEFYRDKMAWMAKNDWIFSVDSDEFIEFEVLVSLSEIVEKSKDVGYATFNVQGYQNDKFVHVPALCWKENMLCNRTKVRWSMFPHCQTWDRQKNVMIPIQPSLGKVYHFRDFADNPRGDEIKMQRWIDCAKWCCENLEEFPDDKEVCVRYLGTHKIDLLNSPYRCSKDPNTLEWIRDEDELNKHLVTMGHLK